MDLFNHVKNGDLDYIKTVGSDVLQNSRDEDGMSVLSLATIHNHLDCCIEIHERCPSLLYHQNNYKNTVLHHATYYGNGIFRLIDFFVGAGLNATKDDTGGENMVRFKKWIKLQNHNADTALTQAAYYRNSDIIKRLVQVDRQYELGLAEIAGYKRKTALHLAAEYQDLDMVKLLTDGGDPDFDYGTNTDGDTPLSIAIREAQEALQTGNDSNTAVQIRKVLIEMQPKQTKVRTGDKGWTLLHHATYKGDIGAIEDIIRLCPDCMELVDVEGRNFLHLAAKFEHVDVVKHLLDTKEIDVAILNGQDKYGHTPLHVAAETSIQKMVECFLYHEKVNKYTVSAKGQPVLDAISFNYDKQRAGVVGVRDKVNEQELKDRSAFELVVVALIATVSFTAGITVPGGFISDGPNKGMAVLYKKASFEAFVISNTIGLLLSLAAVFSHFCTRYLLRKKDIEFQVKLASFCTLGAIFAMVVTFITGSYAVLAISKRLAITVCVITCSFFIYTFHIMWTMTMQDRKHAHRSESGSGLFSAPVSRHGGLTSHK